MFILEKQSPPFLVHMIWGSWQYPQDQEWICDLLAPGKSLNSNSLAHDWFRGDHITQADPMRFRPGILAWIIGARSPGGAELVDSELELLAVMLLPGSERQPETKERWEDRNRGLKIDILSILALLDPFYYMSQHSTFSRSQFEGVSVLCNWKSPT
jgi:hypothetical protein